ncbi:LOW QUALITY PROTEIN: uncharacterized protein M6D78_007045 [Vipera latastei]
MYELVLLESDLNTLLAGSIVLSYIIQPSEEEKLEEEDEIGGGSVENFPGPQLHPQHLEGPPAILFPPVQQEEPPPTPQLCSSLDPEPMETQEEPGSSLPMHSFTPIAWSQGVSGSLSVSNSLGKIGATEADLVPSKKAKLAKVEGEWQPQQQEGPFPSLAKSCRTFSTKGAKEPKENCRLSDGVLSVKVRAMERVYSKNGSLIHTEILNLDSKCDPIQWQLRDHITVKKTSTN